jgi:hypothetical protein
MNANIFRLLVIMVAMAISSESAFSESGATCAPCEKAIFNQVDICLGSSGMPTECVNQALAFFSNCSQKVAGQCQNTQGQNLYDALATIRGTNAWNPDGISVALAGTRNLPVAQAPVKAPGGGSGAAVGGVLLLGGAAAAAGLAAMAAGGLGSSGSGGGCGAGQASCGNYGVCCGDLQYYCPSDNSCGSALRSCSSGMTACHN